ncbi:hypothetical protein QU481_11030 [Crenobacter sp. SG2303]|uniref:Phospholipase D-like domain-containing protein n=1 Tax=Crenobacter oryzisoli TaxID=3056844 RepID=A0ABT7XNP8_9NEIS|nr:hypothetical protein [Crenobacter sp. SG2303]MDN0075424.1 hypothetical protein [Crenobacter sp. SG2303]
MVANLISTIQQVRPSAVLLTSFTFDLAFFEGLFMPTLHQVGCERTTVLVDVQMGLAASLDVGCSRGAGLEYALLGVPAPGKGVFHPKLAYLQRQGDKPDVLVVGSGNLTMPGQGGQLESFDALSADEEPWVFQELAQFLEDLASRLAPRHPAGTPLRAVAERAIAQVSRFRAQMDGRPRHAWLVHTLNQTAQSRFLEVASETGLNTQGTLTALAPFHAPRGEPLLDLAQSLGAQCLRLGLDSKNPVARCDLRATPELDVQYVKPDGPGTQRTLHAKVFAYATANGCLEMTGSVNATQASLASLDNVEVALIRQLAEPTFQWQAVDAKNVMFEPNRFVETGGEGRSTLTVEAWLQNGKLRGYLSALPAGAVVDLTLVANFEEIDSFPSLHLDENSVFSLPLPNLKAHLHALQVHVRHDGQTGRCWLMMMDELANVRLHRELRAKMSEIMKAQRDDMAGELLALLMELMTRSTSSSVSPSAGTAQPAKVEESTDAKLPGDETGMSLSAWEASFRPRRARGSTGLREELLDALWDFLEGKEVVCPGMDDGSLTEEPCSGEGEEDEGFGESGDYSPYYAATRGAAETVPARKPPSIGGQLENILRLAATYPLDSAASELLHLYVRFVLREAFSWEVAQRTPEHFLPCEQWLNGLSPARFPLADWPEVQGAAVQLCVLLTCAWADMGQQPPLDRWFDCLADIFGETPTLKRLIEAAQQTPLLHPIWLTLPPEDIKKGFEDLAGAVGSDQKLLGILTSAREAKTYPVTLPPELRDFYIGVRSWKPSAKRKNPTFGVLSPSPKPLAGDEPPVPKSLGCPLCHERLPPYFLPELKRDLIRKAPCGGYLIYLRNPALLESMPKGLYCA